MAMSESVDVEKSTGQGMPMKWSGRKKERIFCLLEQQMERSYGDEDDDDMETDIQSEMRESLFFVSSRMRKKKKKKKKNNTGKRKIKTKE